jgi:Rrf2 family transcriptional regulator, iron-sulfur cluster assembly transcription factor
MMLTTKARYAVTAISYIAARTDKLPISAEKISSGINIDVKYLEQILRKLKKSGLLIATKGPGGGYLMAKSAEEITIYEVVMAVGESIKMTRCGISKPGCMRTEHTKCASHELWAGLTKQIASYLTAKTLADVALPGMLIS